MHWHRTVHVTLTCRDWLIWIFVFRLFPARFFSLFFCSRLNLSCSGVKVSHVSPRLPRLPPDSPLRGETTWPPPMKLPERNYHPAADSSLRLSLQQHDNKMKWNKNIEINFKLSESKSNKPNKSQCFGNLDKVLFWKLFSLSDSCCGVEV